VTDICSFKRLMGDAIWLRCGRGRLGGLARHLADWRPMPIRAVRFRTATSLILCSVVLSAAPHISAAEGDWTVVTIARDGSWGVGIAGSQGQAIAAAIRGCRARAGKSSDCGAQFKTARGGWIVANLCGDRKIIAAGASREDAERAALHRESYTRWFYAPDMLPCTRVVTLTPLGVILEPNVAYATRP